jgi:hypothetical protein
MFLYYFSTRNLNALASIQHYDYQINANFHCTAVRHTYLSRKLVGGIPTLFHYIYFFPLQ